VSGDATAKLWNLNDGACLATFEGHEGSVLKVFWLSYGLELLTAGADGLLKIWNVKKLTCVNTFDKHQGKIWAVDVRFNKIKQKYEVLTGANDSILSLWEDITQEEDEREKEEYNEKLTNQQQMYNLIREKKFYEAGKLAFDLNMTRKFIEVIEKLYYLQEFKTSMLLTEEDSE